jgi:outer membrane biosynthesis protein TonB
MSEHDRGGGSSHDEPLAFDRRDRSAPRGYASRGPAPLTLVLSVLLLLALAAAMFAFYRSGLNEGSRSPREIGAPVGDLHAAAPPASGDVDPAAGLKIYQQAEGEPPPLQPNFTPPPEQPLPRPSAAPAAPVAPAAVIPAPSAAAPAPAPASPPPAPVTVLTKPAPTPAAKPPETPPRPAPPAQAASKPAAPAAKPAPAPASAPKPAATGGSASVQIGAFSSAEIADREWSAAVARAGGSGRGKRVERVDRDGATLFRTSVTGFPDRASAQAFCDRLKAAGKSCFVR